MCFQCIDRGQNSLAQFIAHFFKYLFLFVNTATCYSENPRVGSSILSLGTRKFKGLRHFGVTLFLYVDRWVASGLHQRKGMDDNPCHDNRSNSFSVLPA